MLNNEHLTYRTYLPTAGQKLSFDCTPKQWVENADTFRSDTGLEQVLVNPYASIAMPVYAEIAGVRRWAEVDPEMLWHPLFWLPPVLANRLVDGEQVETEDEWVLRVLWSLEELGAHNPNTGQWVDVLKAFGIDVETSEGVERVRTWQQGSSDDVLDSVSLTNLFAGRGTEFGGGVAMWDSIQEARTTLTQARVKHWAAGLRDLLDQVPAEGEARLTGLQLVALLTGDLVSVPQSPDHTLGGESIGYVIGPLVGFRDVIEAEALPLTGQEMKLLRLNELALRDLLDRVLDA